MSDPDLHRIADKIFHRIRDNETVSDLYKPLWDYPCVLEDLILMLKHDDIDHRRSFQTTCELLCPEFMEIVHK